MSENENKNNTENLETKEENVSKPTGVNVELMDQTYRLEEMAEAMQQSVKNAMKVAKEQAMLIRVINKSNEAKNFVEFITDVEHQIEDINHQITTLNVRIGLLKQVVNICRNDDETTKVVAMLLKALGIFEKN